MSPVSQCIAERKWIAVDLKGNEQIIYSRVMSPTIDPKISVSCLADTGFGGQPLKIYGEDSWQAVGLAMKFCLDELRARIDQGWKILWPESREVVTADELVV